MARELERERLREELANLVGDPHRAREANEVRKRLVDLDLAAGRKPEPVVASLEPLEVRGDTGKMGA